MRRIPLLIILAAIALVSLTACTTSAPESAATPEPIAANNTTIAEGRLLPMNWLDQAFTLPGTVDTVLVTNGEPVKAGQPLVTRCLHRRVARPALLVHFPTDRAHRVQWRHFCFGTGRPAASR